MKITRVIRLIVANKEDIDDGSYDGEQVGTLAGHTFLESRGKFDSTIKDDIFVSNDK